ncbi:hypothetical protein KI387_010322 [Taxus chinensis]|uniref:AP2/ERF domain-containing protein n=1 Tax=Taxus chinensis TaxID=29808 RepID=A0AA38FLM0_TAXCH|nr:hypothetical protein KI387_010322 [Taxus chinensis]
MKLKTTIDTVAPVNQHNYSQLSIIMDISESSKLQEAHSPPDNSGGETSRQFKGIRMRKWGKWVSEVRMPKCRTKIWLGSYDFAEQAARAYDAAVFCLRGPKAKFNFPKSIPAIPSASSLCRQQIQVVAAKYAFGEIPSTGTGSDFTEEPPSPSRSSSVSEMEASSDGQIISEDHDSALWESLFGDSDSNQCLNLEKLPSLDEADRLNLLSATTEEQLDGSIFFDSTDLWNI